MLMNAPESSWKYYFLTGILLADFNNDTVSVLFKGGDLWEVAGSWHN